MSPYLESLLFASTLVVIGETLWITYFGLKTKHKKRQAEFVFSNNNSKGRILIVGDSIISGDGASTSGKSLPAKFTELYPNSTIISRGTPGGRVSDISKLIEKESKEGKAWDAIVLFCGGMDVIQFTSYGNYEKQLSELFSFAKKYSETVIYISPPNVGLAPIFPFPVSWLYTIRARNFSLSAEKICVSRSIVHVPLYKERKFDHFFNKKKCYSSDLSHPNDTGYSVWFSYIKDILEQHTATHQ